MDFLPPALLVAAVLGGCSRNQTSPPPAASSGGPGAPAVSVNGPRRIDIKVSNLGYTPARLIGKPGEPVVLVFHYDASAGECGREVVVPGPDREIRLSLQPDKPGEVALTLPQKGELRFTCGMGMLHGALVVE